jgi:invasion protein IalB
MRNGSKGFVVAVAIVLLSSVVAGAIELSQNAPPSGRSSPTRQPRSKAPEQAHAQAPAPAQPAPAAPLPQRTEIVRFDNWLVTCNDFVEGPRKRVCAAQLQLQQSGTNQVVLAWTVSINDNKQFVTALQTPTGVAIPPGVDLQPEKGAKRKMPYESCDTGRCTAGTIMDANFVRDITASATMKVFIQSSNGQTIQFDIPIKGFDKASAQLRTAS